MHRIQEKGAEHKQRLSEAQDTFQANSAARAVVGTHIASISDQIKAIESAMKQIENISTQIKLISLNASVEAARAGSAGRGFSVVATEIRRLAHNTEVAVKDIQDGIALMHEQIAKTRSDMDHAKKIGAEFDGRLKECVEEAGRLSELIAAAEQERSS